MLPAKHELFRDALQQYGPLGTVRLFIHPKHPHLDVPVNVLPAGSDVLCLSYSLRYCTTIHVDEHGVSARLSFPGAAHDTFVPWGAVLGLTEDSTGTCVTWVVDEIDAAQPRKRGPVLRLVKGGTDSRETPNTSDDPPGAA